MIFIDNKYTRWYYSITQRAQSRTVNGYTEKHHIIPRSLGGGNSTDNFAVLTAREHFICHWLLTKMVRGIAKQKMAYACKRMMHGFGHKQHRYKISSKLYETLKQNLNKILKDREFTDEWRAKLSESAKIRCANESAEIKERRAKQLAELGRSKKGLKKPYLTGNNNPFVRKDVKEKLVRTNLEKYGYTNPSSVPYTCEICGKSGKGIAGYKRWHGDNCRSKKTINT